MQATLVETSVRNRKKNAFTLTLQVNRSFLLLMFEYK